MAGKKSTALATKAPDPAQVYQVYQWALAGNSEHDIRGAIKEQFPDADATPLIVAAITKFEEAGAINTDIVLGFCMEAYRDLYRRMLEAGDCEGALKAVKLMADLARH